MSEVFNTAKEEKLRQQISTMIAENSVMNHWELLFNCALSLHPSKITHYRALRWLRVYKVVYIKPNDLSLIPRTHMVERTGSCKCFFDFYTPTLTSTDKYM